MRTTWSVLATAVVVAVCAAAPVQGATFTDFESFSLGSVDGQGGWSSTNASWDEEVIDFGGNLVWRVSNSVTGGSFGDMPFAPRPGGIPTDTVTDPDNSMPDEFAGELSTGATFNRFIGGFKFRSATGAPQPGASITISADNGTGGRQSFVDIEESAVAGSGLDIKSFDVDSVGGFVSLPAIAAGLSYTDWHDFRVEVDFVDGPENDVARYYVNGALVHTGTSWEQFYSVLQPLDHPLGVPVQTLLFRIGAPSIPSVAGGGFLFDDVYTSVSVIPEPSGLILAGLSLLGFVVIRRRKSS
jgi:hypothetical protein